MSRFFTVYNSNGFASSNINLSLNKALEFYMPKKDEDFEVKFFDALDGCLKGFVVKRKNEINRFYYDKHKRTTVISDGHPIINNNILNAKEINDIVNSEGVESYARMPDGGHTEIIINEKKKYIKLVRDRIGLKPVYFSNDLNFICSSNAGAIIRSGLIPSKPNSKIIGKYATCNFRANYGHSSTFFNNISLVQQSSIVSLQNAELNTTRYWNWDHNENYISIKDNDLENFYREEIMSSVKSFYNACGESSIAVALSGGVDSGTVIGMLHEISKNRIDAISLSYNEKTDFDESELIQCSVRDHADKWTDLKLDPQTLLEDLQSLYQKFDIPLATISIYGYDYLYREMAKMGYKNIFTGAGGDYFQSGNYPCFFYHFADLKFSKSKDFKKEVSKWIKNHETLEFPKNMETVIDFFEKNIDLSKEGSLKSQELFLQSGNILDSDFYREIDGVFTEVVKSYGSYQRTYIVQEFLFDAVAPGVEAEDLIDWVYGTSMTSPLFSKRLVDLGWKLPSEQKIKNGVNKVLSRKALRGICSNEILDRVQKSGFNAPFDIWLRGPLNEYAMDIFSSKSFLERGIYNNLKFKKVLNEHMNEESNHMMLLWQALNLELWMKNWLD